MSGCNGICVTAADVGVFGCLNEVAYPHPECPEHGDPCPHDSWSGDEGPMAELGRWPIRWRRCDGCGIIRVDDAAADQ